MLYAVRDVYEINRGRGIIKMNIAPVRFKVSVRSLIMYLNFWFFVKKVFKIILKWARKLSFWISKFCIQHRTRKNLTRISPSVEQYGNSSVRHLKKTCLPFEYMTSCHTHLLCSRGSFFYNTLLIVLF